VAGQYSIVFTLGPGRLGFKVGVVRQGVVLTYLQLSFVIDSQ
jgi:hypothetical protein